MTLNTLFNRTRNKNTPAATVDVSKMRVPQHVAIIMDGNGRWAKGRGLPRLAGHHAGTENLHKIVRAAAEHDIKVLTLWAFSTENWSRPQEEVSGLMKILEEVIEKEIDELASNGVQLRHIGRLDRLPPYLQEGIQAAIERTSKNERIILNIALDYGGRAEIVDAVKALMRAGVSPDDVNEQMIERYLYTSGLPDPDLIIRTSGEYRTSGFLPWQSAYAEYYITDVYWPDFNEKELVKALQFFSSRERRFGGVTAK